MHDRRPNGCHLDELTYNQAGARKPRTRPLGKRMREAVYFHVSALEQFPEQTQRAVDAARRVVGVELGRFDVVKLGLRGRSTVSLLSYPDFFREAFPRLREAWTVDLSSGRSSRRVYSGNPPILHRKEEMLPTGHRSVPMFARLTRRAERLGLFSGDLSTIGNAAGWDAKLRRLGLRVEGHRIGCCPN